MKTINLDNQKLVMAYDDKFKNFKLSIGFRTPQGKEVATLNSLLVKVLAGGSAKYKNKQEISTALKEMYGAQMIAQNLKGGSFLSPAFTFDAVSDKYAGSGLFKDVFDFAREVIKNPLLEKGAFLEEIVELEKKNLVHDIESLMNDKRRYALMRCLELTCGNDPYGNSSLGDLDICKNVTPQRLYEHYKYVTQKCGLSIFLLGSFNEAEAVECAKDFMAGCGHEAQGENALLPQSGEVVRTVEEAEVAQGKLAMCFTTGIGSGPDFYAINVMNGLFGGTVSSKLFQVVREQMSLCYYASSSFDKNKGLILAQAGIDCENFEKTVTAICDQLKSIQNGNFTAEDFDNTKAALKTSALMAGDNIDELLRFYMEQSDKDEILTPQQVSEKYNLPNMEQITDLSRLVKLETVYFLSGRKAVEVK